MKGGFSASKTGYLKGSRVMSKKDINSDIDNKDNNTSVCMVSYCLGDYQPVCSTIIGNDPMFYMDYESDDIEEELNEFFSDFAETPEFRVYNPYEEYVECLSPISERNAFDFATQAESVCFDKNSGLGSVSNIGDITEKMKKSRYGCELIEFISEKSIDIKLCSQTKTAIYIPESKMILVNADLQEDLVILSLARELRRAWQDYNGAMIHPIILEPESAVLINRVQIADLMSTQIRIAWELKLAGEGQVWENIEKSSMRDLAGVFSREATSDFRNLTNGHAMASVFEMWFLTERCRMHDRALIQLMLSGQHNTVEQTTKKYAITDIISKIGLLPAGKNYLAKYANSIATDPIFTDVRDRANANFLWFIRFERAFHETEQELQDDNGHAGSDNHRSRFRKQTKGYDDEKSIESDQENQQFQSNVISCEFGKFRERKNCRNSKNERKRTLDAQIIDFPSSVASFEPWIM